MFLIISFTILRGAGGCGEGVVYLTSLGRPTDIGLQFSWARPTILVAGKGRGVVFIYSLSFWSSFFPVPLFYLLYYLLYLFSPFLQENTK